MSNVSISNIAESQQTGDYASAYARFRNFTLFPYNETKGTQILRTVINFDKWYSGVATNTYESTWSKVWINADTTSTPTYDIGTWTDNNAFGDITTSVTWTGKITKFSVQTHCFTHANLTGDRNADTGPTTIYVDYTGLTDMNFVTGTTYYKCFFLPKISQFPIGKMIFIKLKSVCTYKTFFSTGNSTAIINDWSNTNIPAGYSTYKSSFMIDQDWGCVALYSDGTNWNIANYYPSRLQGSIDSASTDSVSGWQLATATMNAVNFYDTDMSSERRSGNPIGKVTLPALNGTPGMCIVVCCGSGTANRSNWLLFSHSNGIDGFLTSTGQSKPLIMSSNDAKQSTGIVFITNGTQWYIAGYIQRDIWSWDSSGTGGGSTVQPPITGSAIVKLTQGSVNYALNTISPITDSNANVVVTKLGGNNAIATIPYYTNPNGINEAGYNRIYRSESGNINQSMWFVSRKNPNGSGYIYYPVIGYLPLGV